MVQGKQQGPSPLHRTPPSPILGARRQQHPGPFPATQGPRSTTRYHGARAARPPQRLLKGRLGGRRTRPQPIRERGAPRAPRPAAVPSQSTRCAAGNPFFPTAASRAAPTGAAEGHASDPRPPGPPPHRGDRHRGKSPSAGTGGRPRGPEPLLSPHLARVTARRGAARSQRVCRRAMASGNERTGLASGHFTLRAPVSRPAPRVRRPDARRCRHPPPGGQEVSVQPRRPSRPALRWGVLGCAGTWRGRLGHGAPPWAISNQAILGRTGAQRTVLHRAMLHTAVLNCAWLCRTTQHHMGSHRSVKGGMGPHWAVMGCTGPYRAVRSCTEPYWAVQVCTGPF